MLREYNYNNMKLPKPPPPQLQHISSELKSSSSCFPHLASWPTVEALEYDSQPRPSLSVLFQSRLTHLPTEKLLGRW